MKQNHNRPSLSQWLALVLSMQLRPLTSIAATKSPQASLEGLAAAFGSH